MTEGHFESNKETAREWNKERDHEWNDVSKKDPVGTSLPDSSCIRKRIRFREKINFERKSIYENQNQFFG